MPRYTVSAQGCNSIREFTLGDAERRARDLSVQHGDRYCAYEVRQADGPRAGEVASRWVRGEKCEPGHLPRVEVRGDWAGVETPAYVIPVVDGDEAWSLHAASRLVVHMNGSPVVYLVAADGTKTDRTRG